MVEEKAAAMPVRSGDVVLGSQDIYWWRRRIMREWKVRETEEGIGVKFRLIQQDLARTSISL